MSGQWSVMIVVLAGSLMFWHQRAWRRANRARLASREYDFRWRQFRRRMQISAMLGLVGAGVGVGQWLMIKPYRLLTIDYDPMVLVLFWLGVVLLAIWMIVLAMVDVWATHVYFDRIRHELFIKTACQEDEISKKSSLVE